MHINKVQNNNPSFQAVKLNVSGAIKRAVIESPAIKQFIERNEERMLDTEIYSEYYNTAHPVYGYSTQSGLSRFIVRSVVPGKRCFPDIERFMSVDYKAGTYNLKDAVGEQLVIDAIKRKDAEVGLEEKVAEFQEWVKSISLSRNKK